MDEDAHFQRELFAFWLFVVALDLIVGAIIYYPHWWPGHPRHYAVWGG
jgi:hypothetical protein